MSCKIPDAMMQSCAGIVLILLISITKSSAQFSGGDGSQSNPYQITTIDQLYSIRNHLDKHFILMNNLDFSGTPYDISTNYLGWEPIGSSTAPFRGCFNGRGYRINKLGMFRHQDNYTGLFGYVLGGRIDSIGLENCTITGR